MRVLIAEDEADIRDFLVLIFEQAGWDVVAVGDGSEALTTYDQERNCGRFFDLLLIDVRMPHLNGITVGIEIRRIERWGATPRAALVYLTGKDDVENPDELKTIHFADDWIRKPADPKILLERCGIAVSKVLEDRNGQLAKGE